MNIKRRFTIPIVLAALTAVGCNEPKPSRSSAIERATSTAPPLTSTVPSPLPKTAVEKKPELSKAEPSVEATLHTMDGLTIRRLVTAPEVEHREPVAASTLFERDEERIYAFVEVSNESDEAKVMFRFEYSAGRAPLANLGAHEAREETRAVARGDPKCDRSSTRGAAIRGEPQPLGQIGAT